MAVLNTSPMEVRGMRADSTLSDIRRRRRHRFLAVFAVLGLVVAFPGSLYYRHYRQCLAERRVLSALDSRGVLDEVVYAWPSDHSLIWLFDALRAPKPVWSLTLRGGGVTNDDLKDLRFFASLESLHLVDTNSITDDGLTYIGDVGALRYLSLFESGGTDAVFLHIQRLENLEGLVIAYCPAVTGREVGRLAVLPRLTEIQLAGLRIGDESVKQIAALRQISTLDIRGAALSEKATLWLREELSETIILAEY